MERRTFSVDMEQPRESAEKKLTYLDAVKMMGARDFAEYLSSCIEGALQSNFGIAGTVTEANKEELIELFNSPLEEEPDGND